ncbi:hypothetical protein PPGU19_053130 [Paraburkholderia sp. PGU19]|nr:hypothetical protein PPGU19_053130 [Paraburkholderia sp. PGU19]
MLSQRPSIADRGSFRSGLGMAHRRLSGSETKEVLRNGSVRSGLADKQCRIEGKSTVDARVRRRPKGG